MYNLKRKRFGLKIPFLVSSLEPQSSLAVNIVSLQSTLLMELLVRLVLETAVCLVWY